MAGHHGSHPRMGAVDVVPFIPVRGIDVAAVIGIARRFGMFLGGLGVPVYYYEDAATRPEHARSCRTSARGSTRRWKRSCRTLPGAGRGAGGIQRPVRRDGDGRPLPAGGVQRQPAHQPILDRRAHRQGVRHINGGFRYVRAIGLALEDQGMVQVSMNLVNYARTPIPRVLETVRSEATRARRGRRGGAGRPGAAGALEEVVKHYLQAHDFKMEQIIETALLE